MRQYNLLDIVLLISFMVLVVDRWWTGFLGFRYDILKKLKIKDTNFQAIEKYGIQRVW